MKDFVFGIWIALQGGLDLKYKAIPFWLLLLGGGAGLGFALIEKRPLIEMVLSCLPGMFAMGFSWLSKEVMGYGDGIVLFVMGIYMSLSQVLSIGMLAFGFAGGTALILLLFFRKKGSYRIPFLPFLAVAYGVDCVIRRGGI